MVVVRLRLALGLGAIYLAVAGCGAESGSLWDNHGFGWHFEVQAENGLTLRHEPDVVEPVRFATLRDIYDQVQACTGIDAPGPFVIVVAERMDKYGQAGTAFAGLTLYNPSLILVTQGSTWIFVAQHEFVHYLLHQDGFPRERNHIHDSPFFSDCVGWGAHNAVEATIKRAS